MCSMIRASFVFSPAQYISIHRSCFREYFLMPVRSGIITFERMSGFWMERRLCTVELWISGRLLIMTSM